MVAIYTGAVRYSSFEACRQNQHYGNIGIKKQQLIFKRRKPARLNLPTERVIRHRINELAVAWKDFKVVNSPIFRMG